MKELIIGVTRFSVFAPRSVEWNASKSHNPNDLSYQTYLNDPIRLLTREDIFYNLTIPNLDQSRKENDCDFIHIVQYSDSLPIENKIKLHALARKYDFVRLAECNQTNRFDNYRKILNSFLDSKKPKAFGLFNIDDDDILSTDYFGHVLKYINETNIGHKISFGLGITGLYENGLFSNLRIAHRPFINIGLMSVCGYDSSTASIQFPTQGDHDKSDRFSPTIVDSRHISYMWTRTKTQDTTYQSDSDLAILQSLDSMPKYDPRGGYDISTLRIDDRIQKASEAIRDHYNLTIPLSKDDGFELDLVITKNTQILYKLNCHEHIEKNKALIKLLSYPDTFDPLANGFIRSGNDKIGYYRYLVTTPGSVEASVSVRNHNNNPLTIKIVFLKWETELPIELVELNVIY